MTCLIMGNASTVDRAERNRKEREALSKTFPPFFRVMGMPSRLKRSQKLILSFGSCIAVVLKYVDPTVWQDRRRRPSCRRNYR